jgi:hypothetical protein
MPSKPHKMAIILGWLGVSPFVLAGMISFSNDPALVLFSAELASRYGLSIIIFLGAVHWGWAMNDGNNDASVRYLWSITPALIATLVLFMAPAYSLNIILGLLVMCWIIDMLFHMNTAMPDWYIRLRHGLTFVAICSVATVSLRVSVWVPIWG